MLPKCTRIAGRETVEDWLLVRDLLEREPSQSLLEDVFCRFFEGRINSRYFEPIRQIEKLIGKEGEGFAIVTLYCSIIEFLAAIRLGKKYRYLHPSSRKSLGPYEYSESKKLFVDFLLEEEPFSKIFKKKEDANDFYKSVRCGLVHEASTKGGWTIRITGKTGLPIDMHMKVVDRSRLESLFSDYFRLYKENFLSERPLQEGFFRKFDQLCEIS